MAPKTCSRCHASVFRRINRQGWLQRTLLPILGFYPWECVQCRARRFYRDSGGSRTPRNAAFH